MSSLFQNHGHTVLLPKSHAVPSITILDQVLRKSTGSVLRVPLRLLWICLLVPETAKDLTFGLVNVHTFLGSHGANPESFILFTKVILLVYSDDLVLDAAKPKSLWRNLLFR